MSITKWIIAAFAVIFLYTAFSPTRQYINIALLLIIVGIMLKNDVGGQMQKITDPARQTFTTTQMYKGA